MLRNVIVLALGCFLTPAQAFAQLTFEAVGQRALGMGGAFVAVADDATAVYWNPAGLASGQPYGATIEWNRSQFGNLDDLPAPGQIRRNSTLTSFGTLPLGLSYGRLQEGAVVVDSAGELRGQVLEVRQYGVTILQSLVEGLVIGSTFKYVRGSAVSGPVTAGSGDAALDAAYDIRRDSKGAFDLDVGVMADFIKVRAGVTMRNLRRPEIGAIDGAVIRLDRQARLGLAVLPTDGLTLAMDVDLNTVDLRDGLRRMIALGGESRLGSRLSVRAGVRWDLEGPRAAVGTVGGSVAIRPGFWLDGHYAHGRQDGDRGFGVAFRAGY